jgi:hypothetical protein
MLITVLSMQTLAHLFVRAQLSRLAWFFLKYVDGSLTGVGVNGKEQNHDVRERQLPAEWITQALLAKLPVIASQVWRVVAILSNQIGASHLPRRYNSGVRVKPRGS